MFRAHHTLKQTLVKVTTPTPERKRKDVIYEVPCNDCDCVYYGETSRSLQKMTDRAHKAAVKDHNNGICNAYLEQKS